MNSIRKFDEDLPDDGERENQTVVNTFEQNTALQLQELGFGPDEEDDMQG